jgi:hypothetical protein
MQNGQTSRESSGSSLNVIQLRSGYNKNMKLDP